MQILDISRTIEPKMRLYPGSETPSEEWPLRMDEGDPNNVSGWEARTRGPTPTPASRFVSDGWMLEADVVVLEGLVFSEAEPGPYFSRVPPPKLAGSDEVPARAIPIRNF